jgi:zinc protease
MMLENKTSLSNISAGFTFIKSLGDIAEYRLDRNGLRILLRHDDSAPVATFMITYLVGSRNEAVGHTGATHLLEHMMFKGTPAFNKEKGTQIAAMLQRIGAFKNATTWLDRTNYYETVPDDQLELAMQIEADRMRYSLIRDEDRQLEMTVVRNEFERGENQPERVLRQRVFAHAYLAHPYHHSTIGWRADIEGVSTARLKEFYDTFYYPNNAVAVVVGRFDEEKVFALFEKYFAPLPAAPQPIPQVYTTEPAQQGEVRFEVNRAGQLSLVMIAHKVPPALHADTYALDVLATILSSGKTSRLYRALIDKNLAISQSTTAYQLRDPSLLLIQATLVSGITHKSVEDLILAELQNVIENGITENELEIALGKINAWLAYNRDGTYSFASHLNEAIASANWEFYVNYWEKAQCVTLAEVQRVAKTYLDRMNRTVGYFFPLPPEKTLSSYLPQTPAPNLASCAASGPSFYFDQRRVEEEIEHDWPAAMAARAKFKDRIRRHTLANSAHLLLLPTGVDQVVSLRGALRAGEVFNPAENYMIASLTAQMLSLGTQQLDTFAFAEKLERVGAQLSAGANTFHVNVSGRCLQKDLPLVIDLMRQMLREPRFDAEEFDKLKTRQRTRLQRRLEDTDYQAYVALARQVFPEAHPYWEPATTELIKQTEAATLEAAKKFHADNYGGSGLTLVFAGALPMEQIVGLMSNAFADWTGGKTLAPIPRLTPDKLGARKVVTIKDKANVDVTMGHASQVRPNDPDYFPLVIANRILGHSTLSSRLGLRIRDEAGLTYGVNSSLRTSNHADGVWKIDLSLSPKDIARGLELVRAEIERLLHEGVSEKEVADEKSAMSGSFKVHNGFNSAALASQILISETEELGEDFMDSYEEKVSAVTLEQVNAAIRKYIRPENLHIAMAGSIDEEGKPLTISSPSGDR